VFFGQRLAFVEVQIQLSLARVRSERPKIDPVEDEFDTKDFSRLGLVARERPSARASPGEESELSSSDIELRT
jgi:hypothetical protein